MRRVSLNLSLPALRGPVAALALAAFAWASAAATLPGPGSPEAWLEGIERRLVGLSGLPLEVRPAPEAEVRHYVFYAPLAAAWRLAGPGTEVSRAGRVRAVVTERGHFAAVFWETGEITSLEWPAELPEISPAGNGPHPLAAFHDRLLSKPLARSFAGLPAGSRFVPVVASGPGGTVERPDSPAQATLWESLGDLIAITHPDGPRTMHGWRELDAALEGGGG